MTEAEIEDIRDRLIELRPRIATGEGDAYDAYVAACKLLAHIDGQAAELTDREGKYVDLLRTKHALAAEVERLKGEVRDAPRYAAMVESRNNDLIKQADSLRDLVREYEDHCPCESVEQPERCERCLKADAWQKKARA